MKGSKCLFFLFWLSEVSRDINLFLICFFVFNRKLGTTKKLDNNQLKCAMDHILEAKDKGEINEDNVLYIVENINAAGKLLFLL